MKGFKSYKMYYKGNRRRCEAPIYKFTLFVMVYNNKKIYLTNTKLIYSISITLFLLLYFYYSISITL